MPQEMAITGTHAKLMSLLREMSFLRPGRAVLDIGAGQGAFSARLREAGLDVSACDLSPEHFNVAEIECRKCDGSGSLPFEDGQFSLAVAVEVLEHMDGHGRFFEEVARVLAPNGIFMFTTPNILSLKSRLRFLCRGSFYSFDLLQPFEKDPMRQHISPFTINRYAWMLSQHGFVIDRIRTDKVQGTSLAMSPLVPFIRLGVRLHSRKRALSLEQNSLPALFGRKLVIFARKGRQET